MARRKRQGVRAETVALNRIPKRDLAILRKLYPEDHFWRPQTRGDCEEISRPCPYVGCKYNIYLDVNEETGSIKLNFPDHEPWEIKTSCSLDVALRGGALLEEVGAIMNLTRERIRQIELRALGKGKKALSQEEALEALRDVDQGRGVDNIIYCASLAEGDQKGLSSKLVKGNAKLKANRDKPKGGGCAVRHVKQKHEWPERKARPDELHLPPSLDPYREELVRKIKAESRRYHEQVTTSALEEQLSREMESQEIDKEPIEEESDEEPIAEDTLEMPALELAMAVVEEPSVEEPPVEELVFCQPKRSWTEQDMDKVLREIVRSKRALRVTELAEITGVPFGTVRAVVEELARCSLARLP